MDEHVIAGTEQQLWGRGTVHPDSCIYVCAVPKEFL